MAGSGRSRQPLPPSAFTPGDQRGSAPHKHIPMPRCSLMPSWAKVLWTRAHTGHHRLIMGPTSARIFSMHEVGALHPSDGTMGVPWPWGQGFPQQTSANVGANIAGEKKKKKRFPSAAHGAGGAAGTSPPLAGLAPYGALPAQQPNSLPPLLPSKQRLQPPRGMVMLGLGVHMEHLRCPPAPAPRSPHGQALSGCQGPPRSPSLLCHHHLSGAKTRNRPVLPAMSRGETQL